MYFDFIIRILLCFFLAMLIGFERQFHNKKVGLRTNVLVALGAFLFVYYSFHPGITGDQMRIAAQVVCGIGFLGAGAILRDGDKIKGLNTAATLWCDAAIGVLTAGGLLVEATIGTLLVLISNFVLKVLSESIMRDVRNKTREKCTVTVNCSEDIEVLVRSRVAKCCDNYNIKMISLEVDKTKKDRVKLIFVFYTTRPNVIEGLVEKLSKEVGIEKISWIHKREPIVAKEVSEEEEDEDNY